MLEIPTIKRTFTTVANHIRNLFSDKTNGAKRMDRARLFLMRASRSVTICFAQLKAGGPQGESLYNGRRSAAAQSPCRCCTHWVAAGAGDAGSWACRFSNPGRWPGDPATPPSAALASASVWRCADMVREFRTGSRPVVRELSNRRGVRLSGICQRPPPRRCGRCAHRGSAAGRGGRSAGPTLRRHVGLDRVVSACADQ